VRIPFQEALLEVGADEKGGYLVVAVVGAFGGVENKGGLLFAQVE